MTTADGSDVLDTCAPEPHRPDGLDTQATVDTDIGTAGSRGTDGIPERMQDTALGRCMLKFSAHAQHLRQVDLASDLRRLVLWLRSPGRPSSGV